MVIPRKPLYTSPMGHNHDGALLKAQGALSRMILSHSGWRGVFAESGGEEDGTAKISPEHGLVAAGAAAAFAEYLHGLRGSRADGVSPPGSGPLVLLGSDTRPTGKAIADAMMPVLLALGCRVCYAGFVAAPEIMAWARAPSDDGESGRAFIYISASHNPIGHNGFKFGLDDGGVLPAHEMAKLAEAFRSLMDDPKTPARLEGLEAGLDRGLLEAVRSGEAGSKKEALGAYFAFAGEVAWYAKDGRNDVKDILRRGIADRPLGVCCDFNGSARSVSIDRDFFGGLGIGFAAINAEAGKIVHRIVPEGESLDPCRGFLEELHARDPAFVIGYVPDCDGDRGNLVIWDDSLGRVRALEAQEVFALACIAELAHLAWDGGGTGSSRVAVAINDPTSFCIDRIAQAFGASAFRAEVGESNVVGLARRLREEGYTVRILGEGAAGGNITHPSAVRDPLHTVLAIAKLLSLRGGEDGLQACRPGLFELWCRASGQSGLYRPDFGIADVIASLPPFVTTGAYTPEALLKIRSADHGELKSRYQGIFMREWEARKDELKTKYGIYGWQAMAYNGMDERKIAGSFGEAGRGGLKICFLDADGKPISAVWMRGSATEPVFRIIADAEVVLRDGVRVHAERDFIEWQRRMIIEADTGTMQTGRLEAQAPGDS